jgi:hypothetical protein
VSEVIGLETAMDIDRYGTIRGIIKMEQMMARLLAEIRIN